MLRMVRGCKGWWVVFLVLAGVFAGCSDESVRRAAEQGDARAQFNLGEMYDQGRGVKQDYAEAAKWYARAANQGNAEAQFSLGWMYVVGRGVARDEAEAVRWYRQAAEQGHTAAQVNLGMMYAEGRGVAQNDTEALRWYEQVVKQEGAKPGSAGMNAGVQDILTTLFAKAGGADMKGDAESAVWLSNAAEQGFAVAQYGLGVMYEKGLGVPQNDAEAEKWYRKAAEQGSEEARMALEAMKR